MAETAVIAKQAEVMLKRKMSSSISWQKYLSTNLEKGTDLLLRSLHFSLRWDLDIGLDDGRDSRELFGDGQCVLSSISLHFVFALNTLEQGNPRIL